MWHAASLVCASSVLSAVLQPSFQLLQVASNQLLLAPCTVSMILTWNLCLSGQGDKLSKKLREDLLPTMINGQ